MKRARWILCLAGAFASAPAVAGDRKGGGALDLPFESPWETRNYQTGAEKLASNCRELLALPPGFEPQTEIDYRAFLHTRVRCRAAELLATAQPARTSHLGTFVLDDAQVGELPAVLMPVLGPKKSIERIEKLSAAGKIWREVERGLRVTETIEGTTHVEGKDSHASLQVLGRGDFDGDGIEDLLLLRTGGGKGGTAAVTDIFVLTRKSAGSRLQVRRRLGER